MKKEDMQAMLALMRHSDLYRNNGNGDLYRYEENMGVWQLSSGVFGRRNLCLDLRRYGKILTIDEVKKLVEEMQENPDFTELKLAQNKDSTLINVKNGVVDLKDGSLQKHDKSFFLRNALDFNFDPEAKSLGNDNAWFNFAQTSLDIENINLDKDKRWISFLESTIYPLTNLPNAKKMIIFLGPPNCGKSVVINFLERVVGDNCYMPMTFADMEHRFRGSLMKQMQLVTCHEMPLKPLKNLDTIKKIIAGNSIIAEEKGLTPEKFTPTAKIVFAANNMPALGEPDAGGAFAERIKLVVFDKKSDARDVKLYEKLWNDRDAFLSLAVKVMPDFIKRNLVFTEGNREKEILEEFKYNGFSLEVFINENFDRKSESRFCLTDFRKQYMQFCDENLYTAIDKSDLISTLKQMGLVCKRVRIDGYPNARQCVIGLALKKFNIKEA